VFPRDVVGQHIGLDHKGDVCPAVTKFAYVLSQLLWNSPKTGRLTRVGARTPKTLFFASLVGGENEQMEE
jgi:hypothetical protein